LEYDPNGGEWHAVPYDRKVLVGEYDHLAIVDNPRYENSIILTPEQFKSYNSELEEELSRIRNSREFGEKETMDKISYKGEELTAEEVLARLEKAEEALAEREMVKNANSDGKEESPPKSHKGEVEDGIENTSRLRLRRALTHLRNGEGEQALEILREVLGDGAEMEQLENSKPSSIMNAIILAKREVERDCKIDTIADKESRALERKY
jgi:hypothetical protein